MAPPEKEKGKMNLVGVVVPYFNHGEYLSRCLESLLGQTRLPDFIIVVDDDSNPYHTEEARHLCREYSIAYERHPINWGPSTARNTGIGLLLAERYPPDIFICLDADDMVAPGYVELMCDALDEHPEAQVAYGDVQMFGFESRVVKAPDYTPGRLAQGPFIVCGAAFRAQMWREVFAYNGHGWDTVSDRWGWEDYLFWLEGLLGVCRGRPEAAVHAGHDKFWYLYRRYKRPDRSAGREGQLWQYFSTKLQQLYGVTLPPPSENWLVR